MEVLKNAHEEFVTVVSVGNSNPELDNFVTVLSIGNGTEKVEGIKNRTDVGVKDEVDVGPAVDGAEETQKEDQMNGSDGHPEEEVDVFRLPGERLGFGLKFEGGNKTSEKVRKLFVQSCASESPASRAVCSWGTLGEGDEVLSIDGVPVTDMTRLDCVRRLKESQLVIKLLVRYRGALRPEVVSAERKSSPEKRNKVPPELPSAPPPVPPRKLRQPRGPADGEANPSPVRKPWDSPNKSAASSATESPTRTQQNSLISSRESTTSSKSTSYESCNSSPAGSKSNSINSSPKITAKQQSPDLNKSRQEPTEAGLYLDARSHDGCSTQGSTSDDTGSSMSTVIDCRFSSSDRFSTISTISTASTASEHQLPITATSNTSETYQQLKETPMEISDAENIDLVRLLAPFDQLEREFGSNPPSTDYLLSRLANSEAVTFVEALGDGDGVVERVTAVVAPNTVLIEETITLQPPLSFQDAPLSYGHETRPGLVYTDLAADSTTHFRPIKDDALIVDCVNGNVDQVVEGPPLPARNHVRRINVNQDTGEGKKPGDFGAPALPPKPMPRKDTKAKRKRPPPPPPPPPRRDEEVLISQSCDGGDFGDEEKSFRGEKRADCQVEEQIFNDDVGPNVQRNNEKNLQISGFKETNKMMEIIEMKKARALGDKSKKESDCCLIMSEAKGLEEVYSDKVEIEVKINLSGKYNGEKNCADDSIDDCENKEKSSSFVGKIPEEDSCKLNIEQIEDKTNKSEENNRAGDEEEDSTDESDGDSYYWQSNLATIGEEEETNSLEFTSTNRSFDSDEEPPLLVQEAAEPRLKINADSLITDHGDEVDCLRRDVCDSEPVAAAAVAAVALTQSEVEKQSSDKGSVNGRMENCGGGQRLPPDGDEFPATYQEFSSPQQQQQYQFVTGARVSSTLASANGDNNNKIAGDNISNEVFTASETLKLLNISNSKSPISSNEYNGSKSTVEKTLLLQDNRVINLRSSLTPDILAEVKISPSKMNAIEDYSFYNGSNESENPIVISEKKITISGYNNAAKNDQVIKETSPPPLPTTRPPKIGAIPASSELNSSSATLKGLNRVNQPQTPRKFSLSDLWRQDDKSEKSVRDKIAMFSSQGSLEAPLFPGVGLASGQASAVQIVPSSARRLSKYKSSEDVFAEDQKSSLKERNKNLNEITRSSFDLTTSSADKYDAAVSTPPSLPLTSPPVSPRDKLTPSLINPAKNLVSSKESKSETPAPIGYAALQAKEAGPMKATTSYIGTVISTSTNLSRATSFSAGSTSLHSRSQSLSDLPPSPQISRTNSLASTFRRASDDMRRTSLNQLIEQRRKGISKLRGLVIPEREAIPVSQAIVDLPEIKSRDSILLQQLPRANLLHDKWGSQSSISSSISTTSVPGRITTSFKIPEPQNLPKYSPAFKRKSLAVYGNSLQTTNKHSDSPKSLESICSPTRSDFSFEYATNTSSSRSRTNLRKARTDYDDSDNDSAVSSSQSSISRGFSPPVSPVPSERSERSYLSTENANSGHYHSVGLERSQFTARPAFRSDQRSSSSSSSPDPRSPHQSEIYSRPSIRQHNSLKRSSSTDTNCSTSSTLTSGSQASAESLSRRVLKPQSVEAINRKNILASARCRSGRDMNGSPLIQRKFSDDEETPVSKLAMQGNGNGNGSCGEEAKRCDVKIAYIESFDKGKEIGEGNEDVQTSDEMNDWVRAEVKSMGDFKKEEDNNKKKKAEVEAEARNSRRRSSLVYYNEEKHEGETFDGSKPRSRSSLVLESKNNEVINTLSARGRSRSAIHVEERAFGRSRSQMSLEEILDGKTAEELPQINPGRSWSKEKSIIQSKIPTPERPKAADRILNQEELNAGGNKEMKINSSRIPMPRSLGRRSASVTDMKKAIEKSEQSSSGPAVNQGLNISTISNSHGRFPSLDSSGVDEGISQRTVCADIDNSHEQFGSISSLASSTSLISQQELAQLVEEATSEEFKGAHDVVVVLYHKENPAGSVGIALAGGVDCETKEITVHRVLAHSIADKDGRVQRGDRILSINGRSTKGLTHRESLAVLKQPRSEVVLVVSRARDDGGGRLRARTESVETIVEGAEINGVVDEKTAWGPPAVVAIFKDGAGLGFSLEGGRDSPLGDRPLIVKKIFAGGAAEKTGAIRAGDQMLEVNGSDVTRMSRIEAWSLMKKLNDGEVSLLVRHPATKSSS